MAIAEEVLELVRRAAPERCAGVELNQDVDLVAHLGLPSIDLIRLFSLIEQHFDIDVFDGEGSLEGIATVAQVVALVAAKRRPRG